MTSKIHFDPLYGAVAFRAERLGLDDFWASDDPLAEESTVGELARHLDGILSSYELNRLNYLKQAGFSSLIYPSATHTRYAHSLGCWYLGEQALDSIRVSSGPEVSPGERSHKRFLIDWLRTSNLQEEFMLALLLHDVGHYPFSHVLEANPDFAGLSHEAVAVQYLTGEGDIAHEMREKVNRSLSPARKHGLCYLADALAGMSAAVLNMNVVSALITGDSKHVANEPIEIREKTNLLHELVSGVIDLDRIDHYHRDSYFMGLHIGYVNPIALLSGMELCLSSSHDRCWVRLNDTSIMQAIALLSTRDMLVKNVFDYSDNVAYEVMLNAAVSQLLKKHPDMKVRILTWTDHELLSYLVENDRSPAASDLAGRVLACMPYTRIGRYRITNPEYETVEGLNRISVWIREALAAERKIKTAPLDILVKYPPAVIRTIEPVEEAQSSTGSVPSLSASTEWFNMEKLQTLDGQVLGRHDLYQRQIRFLVEQYSEYDSAVQFYASTPEIAYAARELLLGQRHMLDSIG